MSRKPKVAFAVLSDSHKPGVAGKIDAQGIFDTISIWGTPTTRECSLVFSVSSVPAGHTALGIWLRSPASGVKQLGKAELETPVALHSVVVGERIQFPVAAAGPHEVGVGIAGDSERSIRWVPLLVKLQPWVELPKGMDLKRLLADPHTIKALRAELRCGKCGAKYLFELQVDPTQPLSKNARPFPRTGSFKCPKCRTVHHLRDIEGRLRAQVGRSHRAGVQ